MTAFRVIALGFALGLCGHSSSALACGINWTIPSNHFDSVNERGMVSLWETLDTVDFGDDLKLPLIVHFRSDRKSTSPFLGDGWLFPLLESHVVQLDERHYVMVQPDGRNRYFYRKNSTDTTLKDNGGWVAKIDNNRFTAWADCGWKLEFTAGKIMAITTPKNRRLVYTYVDGKVADIRESGGPILSVTSPSEISFNSKRLNLALNERPRPAQIGGQNVISQLTTSFHYAEAGTQTSKTYVFGVTEALQPKVTLDGKRTITWDAQTGFATSDGDWKYNISFLKDGSPSTRPTSTSSRAIVERVNPAGAKESFFDDKIAGKKSVLSADGTLTETAYFTRGLLSGKLREKRRTSNGKTDVVEKVNYDELGRLTRVQGLNGVKEVYEYQKDGGYAKTVVNQNGSWNTSYFDKDKRLVKTLDSLGKSLVQTYSGSKMVKTQFNQKGEPRTTEEFESGLLMRREVHKQRIETFEYLPGTDKISTIHWNNGKVYRKLYSASGHLIGETLNGQLLWKIFQDLNGTSGPTKIDFDLRGNPKKALDLVHKSAIKLDVLLQTNPDILAQKTSSK